MGVLIAIAVIACVAFVITRQRSRRTIEPAARPQVTAPAASDRRSAPAGRNRVTAPSPRSRPIDGRSGPAHWVPLGQQAEVHGLQLPGGLYVGRKLSTISGTPGNDPALVDPGKPVDLNRPDLAGRGMPYWPSYSDVPPASRGAYLRWLGLGRPAGAYIGYVFLFFYGVERRVIKDIGVSGIGREELPALLGEVARLRDLYADNGSFAAYADDFLATARLAAGTIDVNELEPPKSHAGWDVPLELRLVAGAKAAAGRPLPADWALSWAYTHPDITLRTPATRCREEFDELFRVRYRQEHGDGLLIKANKTMLNLQYRPASASFAGPVALETDDVPDVTRLRAPTRKVAELASAVTAELDSFSRYVGRHGDRESARAVALLPQELQLTRSPHRLGQVIDQVAGEGPVLIHCAELAGVLGETGKLAKRDAGLLAVLLQARGIGIEPDVRYGPFNFSQFDQAVLWRDSEPTAEPGAGFSAATVLLHLGVMVGQGDGEVSAEEQRHLEQAIERALDLPEPGRRRLSAHLRWLLAVHPGVAGLKARIAVLSRSQRSDIARLLIALAGADGHVLAGEIEMLRKAYSLLELPLDAVHQDLHEMSSEPELIMRADRDTGDFAVAPGVRLDRDRLEQVMSSTRDVADVLGAVFQEDRAQSATADDAESASEKPGEPVAQQSIAGLDGAHSALVQRLAARPSWTAGDVGQLAAELGLLAAGAIETINEAAFVVSDGALLEGDDPVELDGDVLKEMLDV